MMYKVVKYFLDLEDNNHVYNVGDVFPHDGAVASDERIAELAGSNNKQGQPLIRIVKEKKAPAKKSTKTTDEE